jgi:hypothetical protein
MAMGTRAMVAVVAGMMLIGCAGPGAGGTGGAVEGKGVRASVATMSFTGKDLSGVVMYDYWNDLNGDNVQDPGEPIGDTLIAAPEWVASTGRHKDAFFVTGKKVRVRARFLVYTPEKVTTVEASARCEKDPELTLKQVGALEEVGVPNAKDGLTEWEGIFEQAGPNEEINAYENVVWDWAIVVNKKQTAKTQTGKVGIYVNVSDGSPVKEK